MNDPTRRHLTPTTLARLLDEDPTPGEASHLDSCPACRAELEALEADRQALAKLADPPTPPHGWERLEGVLRGRGRLAGEADGGLPPLAEAETGARTGGTADRTGGSDAGARPTQARAAGSSAWLQLAAALLLLLGGGAGGWWLGAGGDERGSGVGADRGAVEADDERLVATLVQVLDDAEAAELDLDGALRLLDLTGELHRAALLRVRAVEGGTLERWSPEEEAVYRFAALDHLVTASREAVRAAPTDPYLNGLLLDVRAERDLVLRQAGTAVPRDPWF
ncbi:MAG: hypothetical protein EA352_09515 [Gemmatimonadales bacterium]|nr:MAG: hypothetical protein EA352_09515 [Gemmatimonadales bacterium]